jgi:hypothetical protein
LSSATGRYKTNKIKIIQCFAVIREWGKFKATINICPYLTVVFLYKKTNFSVPFFFVFISVRLGIQCYIIQVRQTTITMISFCPIEWCITKTYHSHIKFNNEETFPIVKSLFSSKSVHQVDPSQVWKTRKEWVIFDFLSRVIDVLLEFWSVGCHLPTNRMRVFQPSILSRDRSIYE